MGATFVGVGRLGKNPVMQYTPKGTAKTYFSMAVDSGYGDKKTTLWVNVMCWGQQAELMNQWLKKGSRVNVTGEITDISVFEKKDGTTGTSLNVRMLSVNFIDGVEKPEEEGGAYTNKPSAVEEPEDF